MTAPAARSIVIEPPEVLRVDAALDVADHDRAARGAQVGVAAARAQPDAAAGGRGHHRTADRRERDRAARGARIDLAVEVLDRHRAAGGHHVGVEAAGHLDLDLEAAEREVEQPPGPQPLELDAHDVAALRDVDPVVLADLLLVVGAAGDDDAGAGALVGRDRDRGALGLDLEAAARRRPRGSCSMPVAPAARAGKQRATTITAPRATQAGDLDHRGEAQDGEANRSPGGTALAVMVSSVERFSGAYAAERRKLRDRAAGERPSGAAPGRRSSHSRSLVVRRSPRPPPTAIWSARRSPSRTTRRWPRVIPV